MDYIVEVKYKEEKEEEGGGRGKRRSARDFSCCTSSIQ